MTALGDAAFLEAFEAGRIASTEFHHREHVRLAFVILKREPLLDALRTFSCDLRAFAARAGRPELYHETITWAYLFLIRERMEDATETDTFAAFAEQNPDLLTWKPSILARYYTDDTLFSPRARRAFVMPDLWDAEPTTPSTRSARRPA